MYLWEVDALVEDFKSGKVSQKEEFKYMLVFTIITLLSCDPILYIGSSYNHYDTINSISMLGISIVGLYYCYKINANGDNKAFISRVVCIGLPVMVRTLAITLPVLTLGVILEEAFFNPTSLDEDTFESTPMQVVLMSAFVVFYYWYLSTKIKAVSLNHA